MTQLNNGHPPGLNLGIIGEFANSVLLEVLLDDSGQYWPTLFLIFLFACLKTLNM